MGPIKKYSNVQKIDSSGAQMKKNLEFRLPSFEYKPQKQNNNFSKKNHSEFSLKMTYLLLWAPEAIFKRYDFSILIMQGANFCPWF